MEFMIPDFRPAMPELFVAGMSLVILMVTTFASKARARNAAFWLCELTLIGAFLLLMFVGGSVRTVTFSGMYIADLFGAALKALVCLSVAMMLQYGRAYMADRKLDSPEYYLMVLYAALGMMILISASHFLTMYLGLELMSLSLYGLVAIDRDGVRSTEAGMKYFVLGALASGLLLYGMSMLYGATGSLQIHEIAQRLYEHNATDIVVIFGLVFMLVGIAFKLGVVPFHMWVPDVYQGAPTAVTVLVSSAPKLAAFAFAFRVLVLGLFDLAEQWQTMLMLIAGASIVLGNLAAIAQSNIKRMLAYSGISHMGFVLLGLLSGVVQGQGGNYAINAYSSAMFYSVAYLLMTLASFGMVIMLSRAGFEAENLDDFKGLNQRSPWFAGMMLIVMFSMAGIPFFIGFFAKLSVLQAVVAAGYFKLATLAVVMSVIGAFYYLRVVKLMYFDDVAAETAPLQATLGFKVLLSVNILAIALFGLRPDGLMQICAFTLLH